MTKEFYPTTKENYPSSHIFDASAQLKKIITLPSPARQPALIEFKEKFTQQQKHLATLHLKVRDILVQDYADSSLKDINDLLSHTLHQTETDGLGFPLQIKNQLTQILTDLSQSITIYRDYLAISLTQKASLISGFTKVDEQEILPHLDKIQVKASSISLDFICADDQSFQILSAGEGNNKNGISFAVLHHQKRQLFSTVTKLHPENNNLTSVLKHERSHAVDKFIKPYFTPIHHDATLNALMLAEEEVKTEIMSFLYAESNLELFENDFMMLIFSLQHQHLADDDIYNVFLQDHSLQLILNQTTDPKLKQIIWQKYCRDVVSAIFALCESYNKNDKNFIKLLLHHLARHPLNLWLKETARFCNFNLREFFTSFKQKEEILLTGISPTAPEINQSANIFPND